MIKKVLIVAVNTNWVGISRLPSGLERAGFEVYALCPQKSYLAQTKFLKDSILYPTFTYSRSKLIYLWIIFAIMYFGPDLIIPGDEDAILALQNLSKNLHDIPFFHYISNLIRNSLPPEVFDTVILSKSNFQEKCHDLGLRTPKNIIVKDLKSAFTGAAELGFPLVLKLDTGYGGSGVSICHNRLELEIQFRWLMNESFINKISVFVKKIFFVSILNIDKTISIQQYILGQIGQAPFCANRGNVFALNPMVRLKTYPGTTGPASVSASFENLEIKDFVEKIARAMCYTGFGSLEYMVEKNTGLIYIIELNPRPTPTCHISNSVVTNDLCEMFYRGINFLPKESRPYRPYTIAMYPGEKKRDPNSPFLTEAYHDIPFNDPKLMRALEM